jgi:hypothetical protein
MWKARGGIMNRVCAFCALLATLGPPDPPQQPLLVCLLLLLLFSLLLAKGVVGAERGWGRPVRSVGPADPVGWPMRSVEVRVAIHNNNNNNYIINHNNNNNTYTSDSLVLLPPAVGRRLSCSW